LLLADDEEDCCPAAALGGGPVGTLSANIFGSLAKFSISSADTGDEGIAPIKFN
jgi:hypothetical protein